MDSPPQQSPFEKALRGFKAKLRRRRDIEDFKNTTRDVLNKDIIQLQTAQHEGRKLRNLGRLERFLDAFEQYGQVVNSLESNDEIVTFVWGPLKFLLQETKKVDRAFCEVLNAYENLGDSLPLLMQYQHLFHDQRQVQVLSLMYEDILMFQSILLRYFQQTVWQQMFHQSWDPCKTQFSRYIQNIAQLRSLIESKASPSQVEEVQNDIQDSQQIEDRQLDERNLRQIREVYNWLGAINVEIDQESFSKAREDYPGTGRWLLSNKVFVDWFNPRYATIPPLLWLSGIPGSGKTILASLVVEEARKLNPAPTVLFFYFKSDNSERDSFIALGRSLLAQFIKQDNGLLPTIWQKSCLSSEAVLSSPTLLEDLLKLAFKNCKNAYIILDGLDECPREQRKLITQYFRRLIEHLPNTEADRLRCLFISQDDGIARKDFDGIADIKITPEDNQHDIENFSQVEGGKLKEIFPLTDEKVSEMVSKVTSSVKDLFLLAKLIWVNLAGQTSMAALDNELKPGVFPKDINAAYRRIMARIEREAPEAAIQDILRLLGWLVFARRSLKWHEIQGIKSINLDERSVDFERQSFVKSPKELCASLVETRPDGSIEFVHQTVKSFLKEEGHVNESTGELILASLCIDYLNLPAFTHGGVTNDRVLNGDYGFMDYAVIYWVRHLEAGVTMQTDDQEQLMQQLAESLETFIEEHWIYPRDAPGLAGRDREKFQFFQALPFYSKLEKTVASTKKQLRNFGNIEDGGFALNLSAIVNDVRYELEQIVSGAMDPSTRRIIDKRYGDNLFKCSRFSCQSFTTGFPSARERNKHIEKHERPFRCSKESCTRFEYGFTSAARRDKHMMETHFDTDAEQDEQFPTDAEIRRSVLRSQEAANQNHQGEGTADATTASMGQASPEASSPGKKPKKLFKCWENGCSKVFTKKSNMDSHSLTHSATKTYKCDECEKEFPRQSDCKRHKETHAWEKKFVCGGSLSNGQSWGCQKSYARKDTLKKHHESKAGRECIRPWKEEQEQQQQEQQDEDEDEDEDKDEDESEDDSR